MNIQMNHQRLKNPIREGNLVGRMYAFCQKSFAQVTALIILNLFRTIQKKIADAGFLAGSSYVASKRFKDDKLSAFATEEQTPNTNTRYLIRITYSAVKCRSL